MKRFEVLVCYDVDTTTKVGEKRLRSVCRACKDYGQRVQYSIYAVAVTAPQLEALEARLLGILDLDQDSLHVYTLPGGREACLRAHGVDRFTDFDEPLIL